MLVQAGLGSDIHIENKSLELKNDQPACVMDLSSTNRREILTSKRIKKATEKLDKASEPV